MVAGVETPAHVGGVDPLLELLARGVGGRGDRDAHHHAHGLRVDRLLGLSLTRREQREQKERRGSANDVLHVSLPIG